MGLYLASIQHMLIKSSFPLQPVVASSNTTELSAGLAKVSETSFLESYSLAA